jgi:hypothetical protein
VKKKSISRPEFFNLGVLITLVLLYATPIAVQANITTVTNTNDSGPGSLRQALVDANDGDTVTFGVLTALSAASVVLALAALAAALSTRAMKGAPR